MKNKLVIWGTNAQNEKVLIAAELNAAANKVLLHTFPEAIAGDEFVDKMMKEWRDGATVEFPEGVTTLDRNLSATESLLPDDLKVDRPDIISRAQTEWHFAVLSTKLNEAYRIEIEEMKAKIEALTQYDNTMWDSLKNFWDKVQNQVRDRNLWREHADELRDKSNELFDALKKLRNRANEEFSGVSKKFYDEMNEALAGVEKKIEGNARLNVIFDELKALQSKYRQGKMTNEHRNQLWDRLDGAFKKAKEKRFGPDANEGSLVDRHNRRLEGLDDAIRRMEDSVRRDEDELEYQSRRVANSEGQLEAQIRQAKIKLVEERIGSKKAKLAEMKHTREEVTRQIDSAKSREVRNAERDAERQKFAEAKEKARHQIAASATKLGGDRPKKEESILETAGTLLGEVLADALDSVKAVATVVGQKAGEAMDKAEDKIEKVAEAIKESETAKKAEAMLEKAEDKIEAAVETVKESKTAKKAEAFLETAEEKVEAVVEKLTGDDDDKKGEKSFFESVADAAENLMDKVEDKVEAAVEAITGEDDENEKKGKKKAKKSEKKEDSEEKED